MNRDKTEGTEVNSLAIFLSRFSRFFRRSYRWATRSALVLLAGFVVLHLIHPALVDVVGHALHFGNPSLPSVVALMLLVFLLERTMVIEEHLRSSDVIVQTLRPRAYNDLPALVADRRAKRIDAIQFSGHRVLPLIRDLAEAHPNLEMRLLLIDPMIAATFDIDGRPNHRDRIATTLYELNQLAERGINIEIRYYAVPPTFSVVMCDEWLIVISWYYCVPDEKIPSILRLRSRAAPAIVAMDEAAKPFLSFGRSEFESLWNVGTQSSDV